MSTTYTSIDGPAALAIRMARVGIDEFKIAFLIGTTVKHLNSLYGKLMRAAAILADLDVRETLLKMAKSGKSAAATIFWMRNNEKKTTNRKKTSGTPDPNAHNDESEDDEGPELIILNHKGERIG